MPEDLCQDCSWGGCLVCEPLDEDWGPGWGPLDEQMAAIRRVENVVLSGAALAVGGIGVWLWARRR